MRLRGDGQLYAFIGTIKVAFARVYVIFIILVCAFTCKAETMSRKKESSEGRNGQTNPKLRRGVGKFALGAPGQTFGL